MADFVLTPIGRIRVEEGRAFAQLDGRYAEGLAGLEGFSHAVILWWFDGCDDPRSRASLVECAPYVGGPERMGVFATRAPARPNPVAVSVAGILRVDGARGEIALDYIDARDNSPIIDIKPYTPSLDRVERPGVPDWCAAWPRSVETSGDFDWGAVFRFD